jgi:hypothetical protein
MELMSRPATGSAGSIYTEMPPMSVPGGGFDYLTELPYNPLVDDPWERARWRA